MKRYDLEVTGWESEEMVERPLGEWIYWDDYVYEREKYKEEIARLRKALEYYGDSNIYFADGGALAREALAEKEKD